MGYEEGGKQMADFGKDKITVQLTEDIGINAGYLAALYRTYFFSFFFVVSNGANGASGAICAIFFLDRLRFIERTTSPATILQSNINP